MLTIEGLAMAGLGPPGATLVAQGQPPQITFATVLSTVAAAQVGADLAGTVLPIGSAEELATPADHMPLEGDPPLPPFTLADLLALPELVVPAGVDARSDVTSRPDRSSEAHSVTTEDEAAPSLLASMLAASLVPVAQPVPTPVTPPRSEAPLVALAANGMAVDVQAPPDSADAENARLIAGGESPVPTSSADSALEAPRSSSGTPRADTPVERSPQSRLSQPTLADPQDALTAREPTVATVSPVADQQPDLTGMSSTMSAPDAQRGLAFDAPANDAAASRGADAPTGFTVSSDASSANAVRDTSGRDLPVQPNAATAPVPTAEPVATDGSLEQIAQTVAAEVGASGGNAPAAKPSGAALDSEMAATEVPGDDVGPVVDGSASDGAGDASVLLRSSTAPDLTSNPPATATASRLVDTADPTTLSARLADSVLAAARTDDSTVRLVLNPPELGHLDIRVEHSDRGLRVELVTATADAADLIKQQLPTLVSGLEARAVRVDHAEVRQAPATGSSAFNLGGDARQTGGDASGSGRQWERPDWSEAARLAQESSAPQTGRSRNGLLDMVA